jgi:hypothetical protein
LHAKTILPHAYSNITGRRSRCRRPPEAPRFDLSAIGGAFGLGGNQIPVSGPLGTGTSTVIPGGLGDALHLMFAFQAPSYGVAIQMTLPVRCSAANQLEMGAAQIDAAKIARDLAQKNVEAEQQKYELRSITAFEVLDAQARLATVEGSVLQAYTGYQKEL